jgi:hypothetical protein
MGKVIAQVQGASAAQAQRLEAMSAAMEAMHNGRVLPCTHLHAL